MENPTNFENLVLIVGTNPLPDLVTALHFLESNSHLRNIFLIHSTGNINGTISTKLYADNLYVLLSTKYTDIKFTFLGIDNIDSIKCINLELSKKIDLKDSSAFHVNLTGGTKTMGIGVYDFFKDKCEFSYLSARDYILHNEKGSGISGDLRKIIKISFDDIIRIHGYQVKTEKNKKVDISSKGYIPKTDYDALFNTGEADKYFYNKINSELVEGRNQILDYIDEYSLIRNIFFKGENTLSTEDQLKKINEYFCKNTIGTEYLNIHKLLPADFKFFNNDNCIKEPFPNKEQIKKTVKYLDGKWFEKYVYNIIKNEKYFNEYDVCYEWEITKKEWGDPNASFELDIMIIYGYQLYLVSITTASNRHIIKSKAFEVISRARQIGGQEAKAMLLSFASQKLTEKIIKEMQVETGSGKTFLAISIDNIKERELLAELKSFITKER